MKHGLGQTAKSLLHIYGCFSLNMSLAHSHSVSFSFSNSDCCCCYYYCNCCCCNCDYFATGNVAAVAVVFVVASVVAAAECVHSHNAKFVEQAVVAAADVSVSVVVVAFVQTPAVTTNLRR